MTQPAAAPYTQAEIQAVVQQLVLSTISFPIDTLGVRRTDLTFSDFQQAAAGIFILFPNSPFYVLYLGAKRLQDAITSEGLLLAQLVSAIQSLGLTTTPVNDVTPLFNAQAALDNLGSAAAQRGGSFTSVTSTPAFQQFSANVSTFLQGPGQNVKSQGQIVMTPQQARAAIPGLVTQVQQAHAALVASVQLLVDGIDNYNSLSLPSVVASSVLANASSLIGSNAAALNSLTPDQRLTLVRQTVLNLLASQTVVETYCSFSGPSQFLALTGTGFPYSDALHPATPAVAQAQIGGGVSIVAGVSDSLEITLDGGSSGLFLALTPSIIAELDGVASDTAFIISDGTHPTPPGGITLPANNIVEVLVGGVLYTATLTPSSAYNVPYTADQIAAMIQPSLPSGAACQAYYSPLFYSGGLDIPAGTNTIWTLPVAGIANLVALGVTATGCSVQVNDGGPNVGIYPITGVAVDGSSITVTGVTVGQTNAQVTIGPASRKLKFILTNPAAQVPAETTLTLTSNSPASAASLNTLGFFSGLSSSCQRTTPDNVAANINANTTLVHAGTVVETFINSAPAHSNVLDINQLVFAEAEALGSQAFAGTTLTYTVTSIVVAGSVSVGDTIALRTGPTVGNGYAITTINGEAPLAPHVLAVGDVLVATGGVAGTSAVGTDAEFGPTISVSKYDVVVIPTGPNNGIYFVGSNGPTAIDVELLSPLALAVSGGQPVQITASYGVMFLTLASLNTTTSSAVEVQGDGASLFFTATPFTQLGTTSWFQLPSQPAQLQAGDMLYTYATQYNEPSAIYEITDVLTSLGVIELQPEIPDGVSWTFGGQVPYAAIAYGVNNDYLAVQAEWEQWLTAPEQQPLFFTNFNALLNPLLGSSTPTAAAVGTTVNTLNELYALLQGAQATVVGDDPSLSLDTISNAFTVGSVPQVDAMISTYSAKGSDLAVNTLLSGDFAGFFGMTSEGSSYAGALTAATRAVAANDLPVRKVNRSNTQTSQLISQTASPDLEYTASSVNEQLSGDQVQPPPSLGSGTPSNYGTTIGAPATASQNSGRT
jgi:hypothetical protein